MRQPVEIHIEEIVLHGIDPSYRYCIGQALQKELARLFSDQKTVVLWEEDIRVDSVDAGSIDASAGTSPESLGVQIANSVYKGISYGQSSQGENK